jgi:3-isopropylmalate/(R)-2-methylmalate dehydratase small subunit
MQKFERVTGIAAPMPLPNIDTDVIMPKQFLKRIDRQGLVEGLFHDVRFDETGAERATFVLNDPAYRDAVFLIAGRNFGCGSSREHAVWGLMQSGIRAIIAPSFAGIFSGNCEKNGLLTITLSEQEIDALSRKASDGVPTPITVDLESCQITLADGDQIDFRIEPARREKLLAGLDHVAETLTHLDEIRAFQDQHLKSAPWLGTCPA